MIPTTIPTMTKFWIYDITQLFKSIEIIPFPTMSLESQMNSITRLVLILFIFLLLINYKYDVVFLLLSLVLIIILYYLQIRMSKNKKIIENYKLVEKYGPTDSGVGPLAPPPTPQMLGKTLLDQVTFYQGNAGNDTIFTQFNPNYLSNNGDSTTKYMTGTNLDNSVYNDNSYKSINQKLAGNANPKTKVVPIIPTPIACEEYWRPNDFVYPRGINQQSATELFQSGYVVSDKNLQPGGDGLNKNVYNYCNKIDSGIKYQDNNNANNNNKIVVPFIKEQYTDYYPYQSSGECTNDCCGKGNKDCNCSNTNNQYKIREAPSKGDYVLDSFGYYPDQIQKHNIPNNLPVGRCEKDDVFNDYNRNTFTSIIQPGVYSRTQVNESAGSNTGISWTQQFEPVTCEKDCDGGITFVSHDPRVVPLHKQENKIKLDTPRMDNVYDPRFTGAGTSYRMYIDEMTGQPRFYYDDVNVHRMPNYVTRNNIDFTDYGTSYGPMNETEFTNQNNTRALANDTFLNNILQQRTELQERLMRKKNAIAWQQKQAPIRTTTRNKGYGH